MSDGAPSWAFRVTASVTLVLTLALVALGGAVRATDSGLACPDWPFCYGKVVPLQRDIPAGSGFTLWNVWLEHTHRLVASLVTVLIVVLLVWVFRRYRTERTMLWPVVGALVAVLVQATLGGLVVLHLLEAGLVTAHLGMSMVVVACLVVLVVGTAPGWRWRRGDEVAATLAPPAILASLVVLLQILVGGQVTGMHAGLAYGTNALRFNGQIWPTWPQTGAEAIHIAHRLLAVVVAVAALILWAAVLRRHRSVATTGTPSTRHPRLLLAAWSLLVLVFAQVGLGVVNLALRTPPSIVTAHLAVASWIWTAAVGLVALELLTPAPVRQTFAPGELAAPDVAGPESRILSGQSAR